MTLFEIVYPGDIFTKVLDRMYDGDRCESTLSIVRNELKRNTIFYRTPSGLAIFIDFALTFSSAFTSNG